MTGTRPIEPAALRLDGTIVAAGRRTPAGCVVLVGDRIGYAGRAADLPPELAAAAVPPPGWDRDVLLLPGLVDIHHHGGAGAEYGPDAAAGRRAAAHHRAHGSTTLVGSLVSNLPDQLVAGVAATSALVAAGELEGVHLEGPFLSHARRGAQNPAALTDVDPALVERLVAAAQRAGAPEALVQMTFAPERPGADALPAELARHGIIGAIGHTDAGEAQARTAIEQVVAGAARDGRALATHLFNGMRPLHHRDPGPVAAALSAARRGELVAEVIGDGAHLDAGLVAMLFELLGPDSIALITDALSACGMPPGRYTLGELDIVVDEQVCRLADGDSLAGSIATLLDVLRWVTTAAGVPLEDAVTAATATPARVSGLAATYGVGSLAPGARGDVLAVAEQEYDERSGRLQPLALRAVYRRGARV
ncbi:MAG: amidohydrolase family protein [Actinobacteria bacterium]|nr:amidohydrolase family protein [Actinomycetota bacterium]